MFAVYNSRLVITNNQTSLKLNISLSEYLKMENISFHLITNDGNDSSHYGYGRASYSATRVVYETGYYLAFINGSNITFMFYSFSKQF